MTEEAFEEQEDDGATPREDFTFFCALRMRKVLILGDVCFCKIHGPDCAQCIYDEDSTGRIVARIIMVLANALNKRRPEK